MSSRLDSELILHAERRYVERISILFIFIARDTANYIAAYRDISI